MSLEKYIERREKLLRKESEGAWDRDAMPKRSSKSEHDEMERRAATIISRIREYERTVTFGNLATEALPDDEDLDMGGQYLTNKERIDTQSELFKISKMVPKGALLHLHFNAGLNPEILLEQARNMKTMYIKSTQPITDESQLGTIEVILSVLGRTSVKPGVNIFSGEYTEGEWMRWSEFQEEFEKKFPKKYRKKPLSQAENWLLSKMVLSKEEIYDPEQTVNRIWARFNQGTRALKGLMNYKSAYASYINDVIDQLIDEKVMYAELRPMLLDKFIPANSGKKKDRLDLAAQMELIVKGVEKKKTKLKQGGKLSKFPFGLKIIYCTPRSISRDDMKKELDDCIELKSKFPDLICGFDLVGAEDRPNSIGFYRDELIAFQKACKEKNLEIPFLFHAGETLLDTGGSDDPENSNLYDAVLLKSKRIGHGFALMKHPHLLENFRKTETSPGICVEICPISNELLHLCRNVKEHPYPELLAAGIPCTVNTDNPNLFSNSMSHEFYQVMVGAATMTLYSWKQLARWSIDYSCLSEEQQEKAHSYLDEAWREFCKDVVSKYECIMDGDRIDPCKAESFYPHRKRKHPNAARAFGS